MLIKTITPLPRYKLLDYSYGFEIDGDIFFIKSGSLLQPGTVKLLYADKETLTVYIICEIFRNVINFPTFIADKHDKSIISYDNLNSVQFEIPKKIKKLTKLPSKINLNYTENRIEESFIEFLKIIAVHFPLFKNYEKDIQKQISSLLPVYSDYQLNNLFINNINKDNVSDYIKLIEENIRNTEYTVSFYGDDSEISIETRMHCKKCLNSLKYILIHLRRYPCTPNV
jgi:hypothetical protein